MQRAGIGATQRSVPKSMRATPSKLTCQACRERGISASFINRSFLQKHIMAHRHGKVDDFGKPVVRAVQSENYIPPQPTEVVIDELLPQKL